VRGVGRIAAVGAPGVMIRTGGVWLVMTRICTGEVWVRSSRSSVSQKVSEASIEGWCAGVFSAVKLLKRVSMSGPSATVKPSRPKIAAVSSITRDTGCLAPGANQRPAACSQRPPLLLARSGVCHTFRQRALQCGTPRLDALAELRPIAAGTSFICLMIAGSKPLRPRYLIRTCSSAAASAAAVTSANEAACCESNSASVINPSLSE